MLGTESSVYKGGGDTRYMQDMARRHISHEFWRN